MQTTGSILPICLVTSQNWCASSKARDRSISLTLEVNLMFFRFSQGTPKTTTFFKCPDRSREFSPKVLCLLKMVE